ncbi:MAG TPA: metal ABC transporter substrate-binding protein [Hyphomicrobiales bacterium]|nr:metal ABC transporter substrate-binding protein [Hyphomicrobiales bacterium]
MKPISSLRSRLATFAIVSAAIAMLATPSAAAPRVVATTSDLGYLAAAIGGDLVIVETIVPPAADAEAFEPKPKDTEKVRSADLIIRVGLGYDYWLDTLLAQTGNERLMRGGDAYVDASVGIPLLEVRGQDVQNDGGHSHGVANPHYWLDPQNAIIITAGIAEALIRILPDERDRIVQNRERFVQEIEHNIKRWTEITRPLAGAKLIAYHNTWPYFARRFRLDIVDFIEAKPGIAPSPAHLAKLASEAPLLGVRAILHEPYEPEDASRYLAKRLGIPMIVLASSAGSLPGTNGYIALVDYDVARLVEALTPSR